LEAGLKIAFFTGDYLEPPPRHDTPWSMDELSAPLTCLSKNGTERMPKGKCMAGLKDRRQSGLSLTVIMLANELTALR
jgi:hypothetical protein